MSTARYDFDLIVIGGGPAGEKGAAQAAYFGRRVALVETMEQPGGACVHTGTLPSKTLREAALVLSGHRHRELYGIRVELDRSQATPQMLSRKDAVRSLEVQRITWNLDRHGVRVLRGFGSFVDPHTLEVRGPSGSCRITAEYFLVATGSEPYQPTDVPFDDSIVDDSDTILQIDMLPHRLGVVGAGVIGCEYACMFAALGVDVTLIDSRPELLSFLDREMAQRLRQSMSGLGVQLRLGEKVGAIARRGNEVTCEVPNEILAFDRLLYSAGRNGRTRGLGGEAIGLSIDKRGIIAVDPRTYQTSQSHIYAVGDVIGFPALASTSMEQARVAVVHAFDLGYKQSVGGLLPYGIYTIPEVSFVGLTEEEAQKRGVPHVVGRAFFRDNARGKIIGEREGLVKLVVGQDKKLLGVHVLGDHATEVLHIGQAIMTLGGTIDTLIEMVFNYPTLSESYKYAAYDALGRLRPTSESTSEG